MLSLPRQCLGRACALILTAFSLFCCGVADGQAVLPSPTEPIPSTFFGMHIISVSDYPSGYVGSLGKGSAVYWPWLEPEKGVYNWSRLDSFVAKAKAEGVPFYFSNDYVPEWAAVDKSTCSVSVMDAHICTSTVANIADWDDFVSALVTRYNGKIQIFELWNEPDEHYFTGTVEQMVTLTTHMFNIIRSLDPQAIIVSPSANNDTWLDAYWAAGGVKNMDIVSIHGYPASNNPVPEIICAFRTIPMKALMVKYGIKKPIWDTEGSWGGMNTLGDPTLQAAFASRYLVLHWACGVQRLYWYAWDGAWSYPEWGSVWSASKGITPAGVALKTTRQWLEGAAMPNSCLMNGKKMPGPPTLFHGVYTCDLTRSGGFQAQIVWDTDGDSTYRVPDQFTQYSDVTGTTHPLPASHVLAIGHQPILVEN
jgi:Glycosyl hydrolases family 39